MDPKPVSRRPLVPLDTDPQPALRFLYDTRFGRLCLRAAVRPTVSRLYGRYMDSRWSRRQILPFIQKNRIDMAQYEQREYRSYNDFFTRRALPAARPVDLSPSHLVAPCDAKLTAYPVTEDARWLIKGAPYTVSELLGGDPLAARFRGGTCLIFRLAVDDYHRYCYFDSGVQGPGRVLPGVLHTVQPVALRRANVYHRNCRAYTLLHTDHFGDAVQVEVGALMVGRIVNLHRAGHAFQRGDEKGYFEFGGSTVVLLLGPGAAAVEEEILAATAAGYETAVRLGECIGTAGPAGG